MKALSIRQPWAWLIVNGFTDIENRDWYTAFRGVVLVHAGKTIDTTAYVEFADHWASLPLPPLRTIERGGIVGQVEIVGCVRESVSAWFSGPYGFELRHGRPLPFRPYPGKLGFFDVEAHANWSC
jgi:ASCH domain